MTTMNEQIDIRTVLIQWSDEETPFEVDVVVGTGHDIFEEDYDLDNRIFFYFMDETEFESAKIDYLPAIGFKIVKEQL